MGQAVKSTESQEALCLSMRGEGRGLWVVQCREALAFFIRMQVPLIPALKLRVLCIDLQDQLLQV